MYLPASSHSSFRHQIHHSSTTSSLPTYSTPNNPSSMRSTALLTVLSLATGSYAWAQAGNGEWIANMNIYDVTNSPFTSQ